MTINVYAVTRLERRDEIFVLDVFDKNYNIKHVSILDFFDGGGYRSVNIAVDENQNLYMITYWDNQVYVCDNAGKLKFKFERDGVCLHSLSISNNDNVMIASDDLSSIQMYTTEGKLKSTIRVPEVHEAWRVAFHHGICKIIVLTYDEEQDSWFILSYSETGELENSLFFRKRHPKRNCINIKSHPSGPAVVVMNETVTFI